MSRRTDRVNELLRKELSWLMANEMNDPRLPLLVTITRVGIAGDLRHASVFVSIMGNNDEKRSAIRMLQAATGFLRRSLRPRLTLRHVPNLSFQLDETIESDERMLQIMDELQLPPGPGSS